MLVTAYDLLDRRRLQGIEDLVDLCAGNAEYMCDSMPFQRFHDNLCAGFRSV
jgi:hypothetical protein